MTTVAVVRGDGSAEPSPETSSPKASSSEAQPSDIQASGVDDTPDSRAAGQPEASAFTESAVFEAAAALPQVLKIVGSVVAPTTLLTALLFLFGWMYAIAFFQYLGVQITVLNLPIQDYLILSTNGLIVPLIVVVGAALLALWVHRLQFEALPLQVRRIALRVLMPSTAISGLLLVSLAMADVVGKFVFPFLEGRGLSFSIGVLLLAYAARLVRLFVADRRPERVSQRPPAAAVVAEWGALFILVSVGLFWAVGSYAIGAGTGHAQELVKSMPRMPDVVVYSEKSLSLQVAGVREVPCKNSDAAYRFRYEGLKLIRKSSRGRANGTTGSASVCRGAETGEAVLRPRARG